ncbi:MAG: FecR domain-containing protein [Candidatus Eremiobacteraeota bacterium]|nr:FecR domain-containing protein [Candidatus Eremiobacteraeota bacterium]MCW5867382.1 FecR domain-containing protein [Candidatus Eremiobacteraeota bacterium]
MRKPALAWLLLICSPAAGWAEEPVLRLINIQGVGAAPHMQRRAAGDSKWYQAFLGTEGYLADHFKTDAQTVAALEFAIGGRVAISRDTEIEVLSERSVNAISASQRVLMRSGHLWMRSARPLARPLEIQTNGGTLGIKGTEFTVEALPDQTQVAVMEGAVEVKDLQAKYLGVAQAGDVYHLKTNPKPEDVLAVEHLDPNQMQGYKESFLLRAELASIRQSLEQSARTHLNELMQKLEGLKGVDEHVNRGMVEPFGAAIGMSPSGGFALSTRNTSPLGTTFAWDNVPGADGYVIFVSDTAQFNNILFSDRVRDTRAVYPETARPLKPGRYYWRIIPVGNNDQVLEGVGAAQSTFEISATQ